MWGLQVAAADAEIQHSLRPLFYAASVRQGQSLLLEPQELEGLVFQQDWESSYNRRCVD